MNPPAHNPVNLSPQLPALVLMRPAQTAPVVVFTAQSDVHGTPAYAIRPYYKPLI